MIIEEATRESNPIDSVKMPLPALYAIYNTWLNMQCMPNLSERCFVSHYQNIQSENNLQTETRWKQKNLYFNFWWDWPKCPQRIFFFFFIHYLLVRRATRELQNIIHISLWLENELLLPSLRFSQEILNPKSKYHLS